MFNKKGFYGITKHNHLYFAFYKTGMHGNIISFKLQNNQAINVKVIIKKDYQEVFIRLTL